MSNSKVVTLPGASKDLDIQAVLARNAQVIRRFSDDMIALQTEVESLALNVRALRTEMKEMESEIIEKHLSKITRGMGDSNSLYRATHKLLGQVHGLLECDLTRRMDDDEEREIASSRFGVDVARRRCDPKVALLQDHDLNDPK